MIGHRRALDGRQKPTMLPNLIIIGAGKCGTTALHYYLQEHPQIYMSTRKELRFFSGENWERGLTWYEAHFDSSCPVRGEASPQYTSYPGLPDAPQRMHAVIPDAKLIYLVRDPIDRIVSHYVHAYAARWDNENRPFGQAVAASLANRYVSASRYFMQLEQYLHYFSPDRIMIINRQDLLVHRRRTLRAVFRFLGVNEQFDSPRFNEIRSPTWRTGATRAEVEAYRQRIVGIPRWVTPNIRPAPTGRLPWKVRATVKRILFSPFLVPIEPPVIDDALRHALADLLEPDVYRLRQFTGKAFPDWSI